LLKYKTILKKWIGFIFYSLFCLISFAQNSFTVSNPFPKDYFIENRGQWNHKDSTIGFILWTGIHNIELSKNKAGFTWKFYQPYIRKEQQNEEKASKEHESTKPPIEDEIQQIFLNANPNAEIICEKPSGFNWTYGPTAWNSKGYKRLIYKEVYPHIDVYYETLPNYQMGHFKYGFILHPGADPHDIQMQINGGKTYQLQDQSLIYRAEHFGLMDSGLIAIQEDRIIPCEYYIEHGNLNLRIDIAFPIQQEIIVDPYVKVIDSFIDSSAFYLDLSNLVSQIDFDNDKNAYVMSISLKYPEIGKYDSSGKLTWLFSGQIPSLNWQSSTLNSMHAPGAFIVNKTNNKMYFGPGADVRPFGPRIIRLNQNGNFDNYISNSRADAPEIWDLSLHCQTKTLFASGGMAFGAVNLFTVDPLVDSIQAMKRLITNDSTNWGQDMVRSVIDIQGNYYSLLNFYKTIIEYDSDGYVDTSYNYWYNGLYYINDSLNGNYFNTDLSAFLKFQEARNSIPLMLLMNNNRFNGLAVNDSFAFVYDGKVLIAVEKYTGTIRCIDSIDWHGGKRGHLGQSGIAADNCNHVFVGGDSANVLIYTFVNNQFRLDSNIYLFSPSKKRKTIDIRFNELNNQLFVCGDSFTASFPSPFSNSCSITKTFEVDTFITAPCNGDFIAHITDGDTATDYTFQWINLSNKNKPVVQLNSGTGRFRDTLHDPRPGDTFELLVAKNYFCNGEYQKYIFTTGRTHKRDVYDTLCAGDSFDLRQHKVGRDSIFTHTLVNRYRCDSAVTYHIYFKDTSTFSQSVTLCRGDTLKVGKKSYTSAGTYKDTLINFLGCDSFVYSKFNIAQDTVYLKDHVCNTFIYQVGDSTFYKPGLYTVVMTGSSGCDSVVIADISMSRDTAVRIRPNICEGDSFMLLGLRYALPGNYEAQLPRFDGCDSIIRLTLNVRSHIQISQEINICSGDSASVGNRFYKTSGLFIDTLKSRWGCDSIIESKVNVNPKYDTAVVYILCGDSSVVINQNTYRDAQEFSFKYRSQLGCDSLVFYRILKTKLQAELDLDTSQLPLFTVQNLSSDAIKFLWDFEDAFYDSTRNTIRYQFNDIEKTYRVCLSVTDSLGCVDSSCVVIPASFVKFELYNSFSPNDDGFNDRFVVKSNGRDLQYSLMIFNRWGAKVYQAEKAWTNDPDLYWNGRVMNTGPECPSGSYFALYHLYLDGPEKDPKMINGVITVVR